MLRAIKLAVLAIITAVIFGCAGTETSESTGQYLDSSVVTAKVKADLLDRLGKNSLSIKVKTFKDEVQLSGFVNNEYVKRRAGEIASKVGDVKSVRNDLIVK